MTSAASVPGVPGYVPYRESTLDMIRNTEMDVYDFMKSIGQRTPAKPVIPETSVQTLRLRLVGEEYEELLTALAHDDLVGVADGIIDLMYVLAGMALAYGLPLSDLWDEVHENNMKKVGVSAFRADGKYVKPDNFTGPDIAGVLRGDIA